uniref:Uncharacterized protein n=1 Tax=Arundo donax TaxID=35708 RepID=A0A0A9DRJ9_ARUDO
MCQSSDAAHFYDVPVLKRPIKDPWSVNHLVSQVFVICVTNKQGFCCKSIRLDIHICPCNLVHERALPYVWIPTDQHSTGVWVYGWKSSHVLPDLLQVCQTRTDPLYNSTHAT